MDNFMVTFMDNFRVNIGENLENNFQVNLLDNSIVNFMDNFTDILFTILLIIFSDSCQVIFTQISGSCQAIFGSFQAVTIVIRHL